MTPSQRLMTDIDRRIARGVVAGTAAGLLFLLANMWFAVSKGMPAAAPLYDISTIFHFADKPDPSPENAVVGLITHLTLAAGFGVLLALLAPLVSSRAALWGGGLAFGVGLYLVNFQILGRVAFEWFQVGPNQTFELFAHAAYGLALVPFLLGFAGSEKRAPSASSARASAASV
ncbi:MAG TPA: hypothetical protein VGR11_05170 [Solirubrobacteraceae bacterium]|nr:hypothetical protein [Solirubrobacteraceae bacterium]